MTNLYTDLIKHELIVGKAKSSAKYAQNLYAALSDTSWKSSDNNISKLSWEQASSLVSSICNDADAYRWYASGINDGGAGGCYAYGIIQESVVTNEIKNDLLSIGWTLWI